VLDNTQRRAEVAPLLPEEMGEGLREQYKFTGTVTDFIRKRLNTHGEIRHRLQTGGVANEELHRANLIESYRVLHDIMSAAPTLSQALAIVAPELKRNHRTLGDHLIEGHEADIQKHFFSGNTPIPVDAAAMRLNEVFLRSFFGAENTHDRQAFAHVYMDETGAVQGVSSFVATRRFGRSPKVTPPEIFVAAAQSVPARREITTALEASRFTAVRAFANAPKPVPEKPLENSSAAPESAAMNENNGSTLRPGAVDDFHRASQEDAAIREKLNAAPPPPGPTTYETWGAAGRATTEPSLLSRLPRLLRFRRASAPAANGNAMLQQPDVALAAMSGTIFPGPVMPRAPQGEVVHDEAPQNKTTATEPVTAPNAMTDQPTASPSDPVTVADPAASQDAAPQDAVPADAIIPDVEAIAKDINERPEEPAAEAEPSRRERAQRLFQTAAAAIGGIRMPRFGLGGDKKPREPLAGEPGHRAQAGRTDEGPQAGKKPDAPKDDKAAGASNSGSQGSGWQRWRRRPRAAQPSQGTGEIIELNARPTHRTPQGPLADTAGLGDGQVTDIPFDPAQEPSAAAAASANKDGTCASCRGLPNDQTKKISAADAADLRARAVPGDRNHPDMRGLDGLKNLGPDALAERLKNQGKPQGDATRKEPKGSGERSFLDNAPLLPGRAAIEERLGPTKLGGGGQGGDEPPIDPPHQGDGSPDQPEQPNNGGQGNDNNGNGNGNNGNGGQSQQSGPAERIFMVDYRPFLKLRDERTHGVEQNAAYGRFVNNARNYFYAQMNDALQGVDAGQALHFTSVMGFPQGVDELKQAFKPEQVATNPLAEKIFKFAHELAIYHVYAHVATHHGVNYREVPMGRAHEGALQKGFDAQSEGREVDGDLFAAPPQQTLADMLRGQVRAAIQQGLSQGPSA
jgi:hypothetical protein